jgi:hypothetical protein
VARKRGDGSAPLRPLHGGLLLGELGSILRNRYGQKLRRSVTSCIHRYCFS